ncbi:MAG: hypothetical protein K8F25_06370 [Fimbriimonadaceae bacterium]|nr:hypothetical protein [Alphaproteobacteria bacterium]
MKTTKLTVSAISAMIVAYVLGFAAPPTAAPGNVELGICPANQPSDVSLAIPAEELTDLIRTVLSDNIPMSVTARSVKIDGQIWSSGNQFLEFHDNPSVNVIGRLESVELQKIETGLTWNARLRSNLSGAIHLKKMIANVGSHNTVTFRKDPVLDFRVEFLPTDSAAAHVTVLLVDPSSISVTAEAKIWEIGIGHPISIDLPVNEKLVDFSLVNPLEFAGVKFTPKSATVVDNNFYCITGTLG